MTLDKTKNIQLKGFQAKKKIKKNKGGGNKEKYDSGTWEAQDN